MENSKNNRISSAMSGGWLDMSLAGSGSKLSQKRPFLIRYSRGVGKHPKHAPMIKVLIASGIEGCFRCLCPRLDEVRLVRQGQFAQVATLTGPNLTAIGGISHPNNFGYTDTDSSRARVREFWEDRFVVFGIV